MHLSQTYLRQGLIFLLLLLHAGRFAHCDVREVRPGESIQLAVDVSLDGDTILIHDGLYSETVVLYGRSLTITSEFLIDGDTSHIASTVIEPDNARPDTQSCFVYAYGEPQLGRLVGLTLRNGRGTLNSLDDARVGGALYVAPLGTQILSAGLRIESCVIDACSSEFGGGIFALGLEWSKATLELKNSRIRNCSASLFGGGLEALRCTLRVRESVFNSNTCVVAGGAMLIIGSFVEVDTFVVESCSGQLGGAAFSNCSGRISRGLFTDNISDGGWNVADFHAGDCDVTISGCVFGSNSSGVSAMELTGERPYHFVGNVVSSVVTTVVPCALVTAHPSGGEIAYNVFVNNIGGSGGVIYAYHDSDVRIHHNYFEGNVSLNPTQGAVLVSVSHARPSFDSNLVTANVGTTISIHPDYPVSIHAENNYWGDPSGPYHATLNPTGQGDTLSGDSIFFIPWLTSPPDTAYQSGISHGVPSLPGTWELLEPFPNPFNSSISIDVAGFTGDSFTISLFNVLGEFVTTIHSGRLNGGRITYMFPSAIATGIYIVEAKDNRVSQHKKVLFLK